MDFIAKKGDVLFIGDENDEMAVHVLETVQLEGENYLQVLAIPVKFESIIDPEKVKPEYVREVVEGDDYSIDPVQNQKMVDALNAAVLAQKAAKTPNLGK